VASALRLAAAAVVELAYTLFTDGPDEALNPVMLGVAAALLVQLGRVEKFNLHEALAGLLYAAALAGLFATRRWLAEPEDEESWSLVDSWRNRRYHHQVPLVKPWNAPGYTGTSSGMAIEESID
jgi:hypothetical protein